MPLRSHTAVAVGLLTLAASRLAFAADDAARPLLGDEPASLELPSFGRIFIVFLLTASLMVGATYALRRMAPRLSKTIGGKLSAHGRLRLLDTLSVSAQGTRVHLVEIDGVRAVITETRASTSVAFIPTSLDTTPERKVEAST
jgi:hypothetical protein